MILKKSSKSGQTPLEIIRQRRMPCRRQGSLTGQASLEYFILFAAIMAISLVSLSSFFPKVRETIQGSESQEGFFKKAAEGIINADQR